MQIHEEPLSFLDEYARIPIAFQVQTEFVLTPLDGGMGGFELAEQPVDPPYVKDHDAIPGNHPTEWPRRFDLTPWGLLSARAGGRRTGLVTIAQGTPEVVSLEGRQDLAVVWDLRVHPGSRRRGVGTALFAAAARWARARRCRWLKVETQSINVPACRFYLAQGCILGGIHRLAYPELPREVQLLWYQELQDG